MSIWFKQHPALLGGLLIGALALIGGTVFFRTRGSSAVTIQEAESISQATIPLIDAAQPAHVETATFALG